MINIDWSKVKVVIFDVDGTLYDQSKLRKQMARTLMKHYLLRPWSAYDLQIIRVFRKERELMNLQPVKNIEQVQYSICADKVKAPAATIKKVVEKWMHQIPLKYLHQCSFPGIQDFFNSLRSKNIKVAIYSDYPAVDKLQAMGLTADLVVSSTDMAVDALKPNPAGLRYIMEKCKVSASDCLFIGDRDELDGECARQAGMQYYILTLKDKKSEFYKVLTNSLNSYQ